MFVICMFVLIQLIMFIHFSEDFEDLYCFISIYFILYQSNIYCQPPLNPSGEQDLEERDV
jgi:hypothetical protein